MSDQITTETITPQRDVFNPVSQEQIDSILLISDTDEKGVPYSFYPVRDALCERGIGALDMLFEYYMEHNTHFDEWINYLLAIAPFSEQELGMPHCKRERQKLERKVKQLINKRKKNKNGDLHDFLRQQNI